MALDPQFDAPEFNTEAVLNTSVIISGYCGRSAFDGQLQDCQHDHRGDAHTLVRSVMHTEGLALLDEIMSHEDGKTTTMLTRKRAELAKAAAEVPAR